jgi:hypothetical protein
MFVATDAIAGSSSRTSLGNYPNACFRPALSSGDRSGTMRSEYEESGSAYILWALSLQLLRRIERGCAHLGLCQLYRFDDPTLLDLASVRPMWTANEKLDLAQALSSRWDAADDTAASTSSK